MKRTYLFSLLAGICTCSLVTAQQVVPSNPIDAQIMAVQQAEAQIRATEQAVALEKARVAEKQAKIEKEKAAQAAKLKAQKQATAQKLKEKKQKYEDELRALELESKKLDLQAKRSQVETDISLNKARQEKAREIIEKEILIKQ